MSEKSLSPSPEEISASGANPSEYRAPVDAPLLLAEETMQVRAMMMRLEKALLQAAAKYGGLTQASATALLFPVTSVGGDRRAWWLEMRIYDLRPGGDTTAEASVLQSLSELETAAKAALNSLCRKLTKSKKDDDNG